MAGVRTRFGPQRGLSSGSYNPRSRSRGNFPNPFRTQGALGSLKIPGISVRVVPRVKFATFDRSIIKRNWKAINRNPMQRAGNLVRMRARGSIRRVRKHAPPSPRGTPPRSRWGSSVKKASKGGTPPFKMIYNLPTMFGTGQIIGMVGFNLAMSPGLPAPGLHELGGRSTKRLRNRNRGPQPRDSQGRFQRKRGRAYTRQRVMYPKRPFMRPALRATKNKIPGLWRNSLTKVSHRGLRGF